MGATQTLRLIPQSPTAEATPPYGTRCLRKSLPPLARPSRNVIARTDFLVGSEEAAIVKRAIAGDTEALAIVFAREQGRLFRTAFSVLRNKEDAEDAVQCALLSAYTKLRSFEGRSKFSTWLTRIIVNAALVSRRRLRSRPVLLPLDEHIAGHLTQRSNRLVDSRFNPEEVCSLAETKGRLDSEMSHISPLLRSTLKLRYIAGLTTPETARALRINISAAKSRMARARRQLADRMTAPSAGLSHPKFGTSGSRPDSAEGGPTCPTQEKSNE